MGGGGQQCEARSPCHTHEEPVCPRTHNRAETMCVDHWRMRYRPKVRTTANGLPTTVPFAVFLDVQRAMTNGGLDVIKSGEARTRVRDGGGARACGCVRACTPTHDTHARTHSRDAQRACTTSRRVRPRRRPASVRDRASRGRPRGGLEFARVATRRARGAARRRRARPWSRRDFPATHVFTRPLARASLARVVGPPFTALGEAWEGAVAARALM